jgi:hypothetical protein
MRTVLLLLVMICVTLVSLAESPSARNRFNVYSCSDYKYTPDKESFYADLDSFGVTHFETFVVDSSSHYIDTSSHIKLYTKHWRDLINIAPGFALLKAMFSHNGRMLSTNVIVTEGYKQIPETGVATLDANRDHNVIFVDPNQNVPGLIHSSLSDGVFQNIKNLSQFTPLTFMAQLKYPSTAEHDNSLVAQLIFECGKGKACSTSTSKYSVYRYNDTMLYRYAGPDTGYVGYPTIDRTPDVTPKRIYYDYCGESSVIDTTRLTNITYVLGTETIRTIPYRFIKDIRDTCFGGPGYQEVTMPCIKSYDGWDFLEYKVYWAGNDSLYLDSIAVYSVDGFTFDSLIENDLAGVVDSIENWYDIHAGAKGRIDGLYSHDESGGLDLQTVGRTRTLLAALGTGYPYEQLGVLGSYNNPTDSAPFGKYYDTYLHYSQQDYFMYDLYAPAGYFSSSSRVTGVTNVQCMIDDIVASLETANARSQATGKDFWVVQPTFDWWKWITKPDSTRVVYKHLRHYTEAEMNMAVSLALLYGAHGIGYWEYTSGGCSGGSGEVYMPAPPLGGDTTIVRDIQFATSASGCGIAPSTYADYAAIPQCSTSVFMSLPPRHTLTCSENSERQPLWYVCKNINDYLDSMAYFFLKAEWLSAGEWNEVGGLSESFIDSITSLRFSHDSTLVQVGFFEDTVANKLAYIVNRRVMNTAQEVDSQTVRLFLKGGAGLYEVYDVYPNVVDTVWDSAGYTFYDIHLGPGEAKLIRSIQLHSGNWSGTLNRDWVWPNNYADIKIVGDLTVPTGKTLTIQSNRVTILPFVDSTLAQPSSGKIEFHVHGELRLLGQTSGSRVTLGPSGTTDQSWTGIVAEDSGKVYAQYALIRNAYQGCYLLPSCTTSVDTIKNTNFENCYVLGFNMRNQHSYAYQDSISHPSSTANTTTGIECYSHGDVVQCVFENIKSPIKLSQAACPVIDDCSFVTWHDYSGNSAIDIGTSSSPSITDCEFDNYETGIKIAGNCTNVHITGCSFYSSCFLDLAETPWMEKAIDGAQPTFGGGKGGEYYYFPNPPTSFCTVRQCCFDAIYITHVISGRTDINLGTSSSDQGDNTFICDSFVTADNKTILIPYLNIENQMPDSVVWAQYNHWDCRRLSGAVDTTGAMSAPQYTCRLEQQGGSNDPGGPYKVAPIDTLAEVRVAQNYPNPFNPVTVIPLSLPQSAHVTIQVINVVGQTVAILVDGEVAAGEHTFQWNGVGGNGQAVASGVYFYRVCIGDVTETKKMILLK